MARDVARGLAQTGHGGVCVCVGGAGAVLLRRAVRGMARWVVREVARGVARWEVRGGGGSTVRWWCDGMYGTRVVRQGDTVGGYRHGMHPIVK